MSRATGYGKPCFPMISRVSVMYKLKMSLYGITLVFLFTCGASGRLQKDWLVNQITTEATFSVTKSETYVLENGLIKREFLVSPNLVTIDYYSFEKDQSILRALGPEAVISLDGTIYNIGGVNSSISRAYFNRSDARISLDPMAFKYHSYSISKPNAPFPYKPMRGAPSSITWPPKGITVAFQFVPPATAPSSHKDVIVTVYYEMYQGLPLLAKWITVVDNAKPARGKELKVAVYCVEYLAVNEQWAKVGVDSRNDLTNAGWLYVETDQAHGTAVNWMVDPSQAIMYGSFEIVMNCSYSPMPIVPLGPSGFQSFRVHELVTASNDPERSALARHRMFRLLAPHTQENPIFFHMTDSTPTSVKKVIDQMAEVGFEMMIYSFGSGFNIESSNDSYIQEMASIVKYAHSKGIEVGGYDLISLTRNTPNPDWMALDPQTQKSIGSACFASEWYDYLLDKFVTFINKTGLSMVETDGPYGGYACAATDHKHHVNYDDSIYWQEKLQGQFYMTLREKMIYINQPDSFFYQGGSKTGMGYDENQYSLPRWQDISISRQSVYDDTYARIPTVGWMFVPLVVYHSGGDAAMFEPLSQHLLEYEWALAQYLGAGVAACYRGYRLYDSEETKQLVKKWVSFYKTHRDILTSDIVHVRRPDMQSIDCFMHVNPFLAEKGLAMVFNPTAMKMSKNLTLPLYYTGLSTTATVSEQGLNGKLYTLARDYTIDVNLNMKPYSITWFLIE